MANTKKSGRLRNATMTKSTISNVVSRFAALTAAVLLFGIGAFSTHAQTAPTQAYVTWKASNFYLASFSGKALPSNGTSVALAVAVTRNGTLIDIGQANVVWDVDGKFLSGGVGQRTAAFIASKGAGDSYFAHVTVTLGGETIEGAAQIPVTGPVVVLDMPYPNGTAHGDTITLRALPFFFSASSLSDLSFSWFIDGTEKNTGSDNELTINAGGGDSTLSRVFHAIVNAQNERNPVETASAREQFTVTP